MLNSHCTLKALTASTTRIAIINRLGLGHRSALEPITTAISRLRRRPRPHNLSLATTRTMSSSATAATTETETTTAPDAAPAATPAAPPAANPDTDADAAAAPAPKAKAAASKAAAALPPLSAAEFKEYNRLAEHMDLFHNHFRHTWNLLYTSASSGRRAQGLSMRGFINAGLEFVSHLETHHTIEERYVFPPLARRMPEFRTGRERDLPPLSPSSESEKEKSGKKLAAELLRQHEEIHKGMDGLRDYLRRCLAGETELQMSALKAQLDTWGTVLWTHLDQEVKTLGAENMRKYWSVDEVRRMPM
ncbi:hypothetical protein F4777DRAFT_570305 [Nemania sp. FL0916]|nr:hypothetical protein F4777DRAFT_570305 [Nemania sp. FL0916]